MSMSIATHSTDETHDAAPTSLPLSTVCEIKSIVPEPSATGDIFRVSLANEIGTEFSARFWAAELVTYEGFQAGLLSRYGAEFDDCNFVGKRGHDRWQTAIYDLVGEELPR